MRITEAWFGMHVCQDFPDFNDLPPVQSFYKQCIGETEDLNSKKRIGLVSLRAHAKVHTPTTTAVILA